MTTVVDASVVVKWYVPERHHEEARRLRDDSLDGELAAPAILPFEVANALNYNDHYDDDMVAQAARTIPEYGITLVEYGDLDALSTVMTTVDVSVYDAAYVALAEERDSVAYTADQRLIDTLADSQYADAAEHVRTYT